MRQLVRVLGGAGVVGALGRPPRRLLGFEPVVGCRERHHEPRVVGVHPVARLEVAAHRRARSPPGRVASRAAWRAGTRPRASGARRRAARRRRARGRGVPRGRGARARRRGGRDTRRRVRPGDGRRAATGVVGRWRPRASARSSTRSRSRNASAVAEVEQLLRGCRRERPAHRAPPSRPCARCRRRSRTARRRSRGTTPATAPTDAPRRAPTAPRRSPRGTGSPTCAGPRRCRRCGRARRTPRRTSSRYSACSSSTSRMTAGSVRARTNSRMTASRRNRRGRPPVGTTIEWSSRRSSVPSAPGWVTATARSTSKVRGSAASRQSTLALLVGEQVPRPLERGLERCGAGPRARRGRGWRSRARGVRRARRARGAARPRPRARARAGGRRAGRRPGRRASRSAGDGGAAERVHRRCRGAPGGTQPIEEHRRRRRHPARRRRAVRA